MDDTAEGLNGVHHIRDDFIASGKKHRGPWPDATRKDRDHRKLIPRVSTLEIMHRACKAVPDLAQKLSYMEGIIFRRHQLLIPRSPQAQVINISYEGHLGIVKTKHLLCSKACFQ